MFYKWMQDKEHTVKSFNKIFNLSKLDEDLKEKVEIGMMYVGGLREVRVKDKVFYMELKSSNMTILKGDKPFLNKAEEKVLEYITKKEVLIGRKEIIKKLKFSRKVVDTAIKSLQAKDVVRIDRIPHSKLKKVTLR